MKKYSSICAALVLLAACGGDDEGNAIVVQGEVHAALSGNGMPADESQKAYEHDEMWLDIDPTGGLSGFSTHNWDWKPGQRHYDLRLAFAPVSTPGSTPLLAASVCIATCAKEEEDGCEGPCFHHIDNATVDVRAIADDGKSFEIDFAFDVAETDEAGARVIHVTGGSARTTD
jgi:hypothetical protein